MARVFITGSSDGLGLLASRLIGGPSQLGTGSTRSAPPPGGAPRNSTHARFMHGQCFAASASDKNDCTSSVGRGERDLEPAGSCPVAHKPTTARDSDERL
jgi:hypothetical protein